MAESGENYEITGIKEEIGKKIQYPYCGGDSGGGAGGNACGRGSGGYGGGCGIDRSGKI